MPRIDYFSETLGANLGGRAVRGVISIGGAQVFGVGLKVLAIPILGRLVPPADFGLMAVALAIGGFSGLFIDAGLSLATIQSPQISRRQVSTLFWISSAIGLAAGVAVAVLAPLLSTLYGDPRLTPILWVFAPTYVLAGLTTQPIALMRRGLQNRDIAVIEVVAQVLAFGAGIAVAWWWRSYWALVVVQVAPGVVRFVGAWLRCDWRPSAPRWAEGAGPMVETGATMLGANLVNYTSVKADRLLLGATADMTDVGYYDRALEVLIASMRQVTEPIGAVLTPVLSRAIDRPASYRAAYETSLLGLTALTAPIVATLLLAPGWFVRTALGPGWEVAVPLVQVLSIGVWQTPINISTGWLFASQGRVGELLRWNTLDVVTRLVTVPLGSAWGGLGLAVASVLRIVGLSPELYRRVGRSGPVSGTLLWRLVGVQLAAVMGGVATGAPVASIGFEPAHAPLALLATGVATMVGSWGVLSLFKSFRASLLLVRSALKPGAAIPAPEGRPPDRVETGR